MVLSKILEAVAGSWRRPTVVQLFRDASRYRDEGRFEEAADLVAHGLQLDPDSTVGHLLAGSLHAVFREMDQARAAFERVLALDPAHPRALLGLARIALEEGDGAACTDYLNRALERYPDFPEAQALLEVAATAPAADVAAVTATSPLRLDRLRVPAESREVVVGRADGALLLAQPRGARSPEQAARTAQICRITAALLSRAGLGAARHAVIEGLAETTYVRSDGAVFVSLTLSRDVETSAGLVHLERVWANCRAELEHASQA